MKKQKFKSLSLKKNVVANFDGNEINGGISGGACVKSNRCPISHNCPPTVVHTCQYSDQRTCTLSYIYCTS
ncbi:MAG: hypothetical protein AAF611_14890 [Bacteroidota bacterium]